MPDEASRLLCQAKTAPISAGYDAWCRARSACGRDLPSRQDLEAAGIEDTLPYVLFIDVVRDGAYCRFRYSFAGSHVAELFNGDVTNKYLEHIGHLRVFDDLFRRFSVAVDDKALVYGISPTPPNCVPARCYEHLTLPLSSDGRSVDTLFAVRCGLPASETPCTCGEEIWTAPLVQTAAASP